MRSAQDKTMPDSLILATLVHAFIGWTYLRLSRIVVDFLPYNAYMSLLPAVLLISPFVWIAYDFRRRYNGHITALFRVVLGRPLGFLFSLAYIGVFLVIAVVALKQSQLMVLNYFPGAGAGLFVVFLVLSSYTAAFGPFAVGRLASFLLIIPLVIFYGFHLLGLSNVDLLKVRPLLTGSPVAWLVAGYEMLYILLPVTAVFIYLPYFHKPKSILKVSLTAMALTVPLFFITMFGTLGTFGPGGISRLAWPEVEFFRIIDYPFLLLEQAGLFFIITWFAFFFVGFTHVLFAIGNELNITFPKIGRNWFIAGVVIVVFFFNQMPVSILDSLVFDNLRGYFLGFYLLLPGVTWLVARIRFGKRLIE